MDSSGQMRGWFKLIETIRKTDPQPTTSTEPVKTPSNSSVNNSNGSPLKSLGTSNHDHPSPQSPNIITASTPTTAPLTPVHISEEEPVIKIEPTTKTKEPKRPTVRRKKITIRKSTKSKEFPLNHNNTSNDDHINIDAQQRKRSSAETITPLATDLESLPGHDQIETRDQRFLNYTDTNTLSKHFNACLYINKKSNSSTYSSKQLIFKTRHNILSKIFKMSSNKTNDNNSKSLQRNLSSKVQETKSNSSSLFKIDWSVNRRNSSSYRREPKNMFHILQLNPKKDLHILTNTLAKTPLSNDEQQLLDYEHIKQLLVRTYYPHLHIAVQSRNYFGSKPKLPVEKHDLKLFINPESSLSASETEAITPSSPLTSAIETESKSSRGRRLKSKALKEKPLPIISTERRVSEEIPPVMINETTVVASPEIEINHNTSRKRKTSVTVVSTVNKKRFVRSPSPEFSNEYIDATIQSDSDDDTLPNEPPRPIFVKNGLRSNYYKTTIEGDIKSSGTKMRNTRRRQQLSGALPPFYTEIFESNDDKSSYVDYQLPFDIYWLSQQPTAKTDSSTKTTFRQKKNKSNPPKQKPPVANKKTVSNSTVVEPKLPPTDITNKSPAKLTHISRDWIKFEDLTLHEKQVISNSSTFLIRNLRRIKQRRECKDKIINQQKAYIDEQPLPLFFAQNFYHKNNIEQNESSPVSHRDLLNLFSNHIRRSIFYKTGRCLTELIDATCYFAQLGQLTLILNEIFELLLNYKCHYSDIYPSNALKKCPLKRLFPMYYELILKPIDLTIIRNKLDNGEYLSYDSFEEDLLLLFQNAITYCGEYSDVGRAVRELENYFIDVLKSTYQPTLDLFHNLNKLDKIKADLNALQQFITRLHEKEIIEGQVRQALFDAIFTIDQMIPVIDKTVFTNTTSTNRTTKHILPGDFIVHCRCGSVYDETVLVQCYACQLWQHASCVTIADYSRPYYCFECDPMCERDASLCAKANIRVPLSQPSAPISNDHYSSYSTITRSDGFTIRVNECYFIQKQDCASTDYDIFCIERLWIDDKNTERASGFYYLRSHETFHEANRKFFSNELFRFPSTNDSIDIDSIVRPCYVLDVATYCKGKPLCEYSSRILRTELFVCEYRVDKQARIFTRLPKSKHSTCNMKSYCFDNYIEKLSIKREYQPHQKEYRASQQQTPRRRSTTHPMKLTAKQLEEKSFRIDGIIEKIYCRFHHPNLIPNETKFSPNQFLPPVITDDNNNRASKRLRTKPSSSATINKKRRTQSISSNDNATQPVVDNIQYIVSSLIGELIEIISP